MSSPQIQDNPQMQLALDFIRSTGDHIFLTGKAGTGKTTFLRRLGSLVSKTMVVVAPTGVAALNAGGVTIHSLFQLPFGPIPPGTVGSLRQRFNRQKIAILRSIDLLVIDEVSMVRADVMDALSDILRRFRNPALPFGGVQLLMIGDVSQLAPVTRDEDFELLRDYYPDSMYFFDSLALRQSSMRTIELQTIYRQQDLEFISLLEAVRTNMLTPETLRALNARCIANFTPPENEPYITLTSHVHKARTINQRHMDLLASPEHTYRAQVTGEFPESMYPNDYDLLLKPGAQVMFLRNDPSPDKLYYNGKIGTVVLLDENRIVVETQTEAGEKVEVEVQVADWSNMQYSVEGGQITQTLLGTFLQYPLKAAWAITIHKSQGLTFERAIVDAGESFSHGQVYVALSRCRTLDGLVLSSPISARGVIYDGSVQSFSDYVQRNQPSHEEFRMSTEAYFESLMVELFDFREMDTQFEKLNRLCAQKLFVAYPVLSDQTLPTALREFRERVVSVGERTGRRIRSLFSQTDGMVEKASSAKSEMPNLPPECSTAEALLRHELPDLVRRAAVYHYQHLSSTIEPLIIEFEDVEIDNKDTASRLKELLEVIVRLLRTRLYLLSAFQVETVVSIESYLELRAKAILRQTEVEKKKSSKRSSDVNLSDDIADSSDIPRVKIDQSADIQNRELFDILRAWRHSEAETLGLPPYTILHQSALVTMANTMPATEQQMRTIKGIGKRFMERYAKEVGQIILDYRAEKQIELFESQPHANTQQFTSASSIGAESDLFSVTPTEPMPHGRHQPHKVSDLNRLRDPFDSFTTHVQHEPFRSGSSLDSFDHKKAPSTAVQPHTQPSTPKEPKVKKEPRVKSDLQSVELFERGLSIAQIAHERGLSESTVTSHLTSYVASGRIDVFSLVEPYKVAMTKAILVRHTTRPTLSELRTELGDTFSYNDIRLAITYINSKESSESDIT